MRAPPRATTHQRQTMHKMPAARARPQETHPWKQSANNFWQSAEQGRRKSAGHVACGKSSAATSFLVKHVLSAGTQSCASTWQTHQLKE